MTFEEYLIDKHAEQYVGVDDNMPDDFDNWLEGLDCEDYCRYAEKWHNSEMRRVLNRVKKSFNEKLGEIVDCPNSLYICVSQDLYLVIDKELKSIKEI